MTNLDASSTQILYNPNFPIFSYNCIPTTLDILPKVAWEAYTYPSLLHFREEIDFSGSKKAFGFGFAGQLF